MWVCVCVARQGSRISEKLTGGGGAPNVTSAAFRCWQRQAGVPLERRATFACWLDVSVDVEPHPLIAVRTLPPSHLLRPSHRLGGTSFSTTLW